MRYLSWSKMEAQVAVLIFDQYPMMSRVCRQSRYGAMRLKNGMCLPLCRTIYNGLWPSANVKGAPMLLLVKQRNKRKLPLLTSILIIIPLIYRCRFCLEKHQKCIDMRPVSQSNIMSFQVKT